MDEFELEVSPGLCFISPGLPSGMPKLLAPERAGRRLLYWLVMVAMLPSSFFNLTVNFSL